MPISTDHDDNHARLCRLSEVTTKLLLPSFDVLQVVIKFKIDKLYEIISIRYTLLLDQSIAITTTFVALPMPLKQPLPGICSKHIF